MKPLLGLHVESHGHGPPLVLAHGFGGSARNFGPQVRALRARHRVVVFDARGHARSPAPTAAGAYDGTAFVEDLRGVLDGQQIASAVVGGLSMGAATALHFALAHPERVDALVLASFPSAGDGLARHAGAFAAAIEREGLEAAGARFVWGPDSGLDPEAAERVRQGFLEHAPHALAHTLRGWIGAMPAPASLAPRLAALARPALVVAGTGDPVGVAASRDLAALLPGARLALIPGAGHVVNLARPRAFNAALAEFLDSLPLGQGA